MKSSSKSRVCTEGSERYIGKDREREKEREGYPHDLMHSTVGIEKSVKNCVCIHLSYANSSHNIQLHIHSDKQQEGETTEPLTLVK